MPADIVAEATFTNPTDGEPALSHVRWALESGKHVCTTNKGPVALAGQALKALAAEHGVSFEFEGSVLSGTPILRTAQRLLGGLQIEGVQGIMNGTSNYILGRLEEGVDLPSAVAEAQERGYAEADPTADLEGHDVQLKVMILANEVLGARLRREDVPCEGISGITTREVQDAASKGLHWKLVGSAKRRADGTVDARVAPQALPAGHPLAGTPVRTTRWPSTPIYSAPSRCPDPAPAASRPPTPCSQTSSRSTIATTQRVAMPTRCEWFRRLSVTDAIEQANAVDYRLHAGIFTARLGRALTAARLLEAGGLMINDSSDYRFDAMPFGGFKYGSMGGEGVRFAFEEMTQPKVVCINHCGSV